MTDEEESLLRTVHVKDAIVELRAALRRHTFDTLVADPDGLAAFKWRLLVLSEASRGILDDWKSEFGPLLPWRAIRDLGNGLRHAYPTLDLRILWRIYTEHLDPLEAAIDAMIAAHGPMPRPPPRSA